MITHSESERPFRILAVDTALGATSACVLEAGAEQPLAAESVEMARGHGEALLPLVQRVMAGVEGGFAGIDRVSVSVGPGSFTGLRIGIAAARAIGLAAGVPVVGVSTLSAYAAPLVSTGEPGVVAVALDARHGSVYFQAYAPGGRTLVSARVISLREAVRAIGAGPARLAGTGAAALAIEAWSLGMKAHVADMKPAPDIAWIARLGMAADPEGARPVPLYLQAARVTPQDGGRIARA